MGFAGWLSREYEDLFRRYFKDDELVIIKLDGVGNLSTFSMQIDVLAGQTEVDLVYFAEDNYLWDRLTATCRC